MTSTDTMTISNRIDRLLHELGIEQAHFAARNPGDLTGLAAEQPERFASLTLVLPSLPEAGVPMPLASRLLVFREDSARYDAVGALVESLPGARLAVVYNDVA